MPAIENEPVVPPKNVKVTSDSKPWSPGFKAGVMYDFDDELLSYYDLFKDPGKRREKNEIKVQKMMQAKQRANEILTNKDLKKQVVMEQVKKGITPEQLIQWYKGIKRTAKQEVPDAGELTREQYKAARQAIKDKALKENPLEYMGDAVAGAGMTGIGTAGLAPGMAAFLRLLGVGGKAAKTLAPVGLGMVEGGTATVGASKKPGLESLQDAPSGMMFGTAGALLPQFGSAIGKTGKAGIKMLGGQRMDDIGEGLRNPYARADAHPTSRELGTDTAKAVGKFQEHISKISKDSARYLSSKKDINVKYISDRLNKPAGFMGITEKVGRNVEIAEPDIAKIKNKVVDYLEKKAVNGNVSQKDLKKAMDQSRRRTKYTSKDNQPLANSYYRGMNAEMNRILKGPVDDRTRFGKVMDELGISEKIDKIKATKKKFDIDTDPMTNEARMGDNTIARIKNAIKDEHKVPRRDLLENLTTYDKDLIDKFKGSMAGRHLKTPNDSKMTEIAQGLTRAAVGGAVGYGFGADSQVIALIAGAGAVGGRVLQNLYGRKVANQLIDILGAKGPREGVEYLGMIDPAFSRNVYRELMKQYDDMDDETKDKLLKLGKDKVFETIGDEPSKKALP